MFYVCVERFDVTGIVGKILETKRRLRTLAVVGHPPPPRCNVDHLLILTQKYIRHESPNLHTTLARPPARLPPTRRVTCGPPRPFLILIQNKHIHLLFKQRIYPFRNFLGPGARRGRIF